MASIIIGCSVGVGLGVMDGVALGVGVSLGRGVSVGAGLDVWLGASATLVAGKVAVAAGGGTLVGALQAARVSSHAARTRGPRPIRDRRMLGTVKAAPPG
jgi:hypothetical protein